MNAVAIKLSLLGLSASALLAINSYTPIVKLAIDDADAQFALVTASTEAGSAGAVDLLLAGEVPAEIFMPTGPAPETGAASSPNTPQPSGPQGLSAYPVAGSGLIPAGSMSAHYVYYDLQTIGLRPPVNLENRIAFVKGAGAFGSIANQAASFNPSAIFIISDSENPTAPQVTTGVPTYSISAAQVARLGLTLNSAQHDVISTQPIRLRSAVTPSVSNSTAAKLNSHGPNDKAADILRH